VRTCAVRGDEDFVRGEDGKDGSDDDARVFRGEEEACGDTDEDETAQPGCCTYR
jgi:hypothetical protein